VIHPACVLPGVFDRALAAFMAVLDGSTLADLIVSPADMAESLRPHRETS
jgi:DNA-binding IscR family transcriptional regulator